MLVTIDFCHLFRARTQATSQNSMKLPEMKTNIEKMIHIKILEQGLQWTPTIHDRHLIKHATNMHSIGLNNKPKHRGIKLI